ILYPFTLLGTWFHEMGHGLMALALGGDFTRLEILPNGSGYAMHSGSPWLGGVGEAIIASAGPIGPTIAGSIFLLCSDKPKTAKFILMLLGLVLIISVMLWVRSLFAIILLIVFAVVTIFISIRKPSRLQQFTLQFFGVQAFASLYLNIDYLFSAGGVLEGHQFLSDTSVIADKLFLPYWFWGGALLVFSIVVILSSCFIVLKRSLQKN
ncbi:M50 family metallopeptidase, partial [Dolichospermum sp. ST_sed3]|nr:M50 family metallopeptidase [Dolichospermum sp. ST_sed3]